MRAAIIENEGKMRKVLKQLLTAHCPEVEVVDIAKSVAEGQLLLARNPDLELLFLDVELGDGTGMDLLEQVDNQKFKLIFITAHSEYAIQAFKFSAIEFLLKPIDPDDLINSVHKAKEQIEKENLHLQLKVLLNQFNGHKQIPEKLVVRDRENVYILKIADILFLESQGAYTLFHMQRSKQVLSSKNLKHYEALLKPVGFRRLHHSFLINPPFITRYDKVNNCLILDEQAEVPVSIRRKEELFSLLGKLGL